MTYLLKIYISLWECNKDISPMNIWIGGVIFSGILKLIAYLGNILMF